MTEHRGLPLRLYLDNCSLQRPLDSKIQLRVAVEAEAVLGLISLCESGNFELISSDALLFEVLRNPNPVRRGSALQVLSQAGTHVAINSQLENRAKLLVERGVKPLDALHLASAEEARADYLCSCDDGFVRRTRSMDDLKTRVVSPLELMEEIEHW